MPRYLLKARPDLDFYVIWSTVVDNAVWAGTREELRQERPEDYRPDRFERADQQGTSAWRPRSDGEWGDAELLVCNVDDWAPGALDNNRSYLLRRRDLGAYGLFLRRDMPEEACALLEPARWEGDAESFTWRYWSDGEITESRRHTRGDERCPECCHGTDRCKECGGLEHTDVRSHQDPEDGSWITGCATWCEHGCDADEEPR